MPEEWNLRRRITLSAGEVAYDEHTDARACILFYSWIPAPRFRGDKLRGNDGTGSDST